MKTLICEFNQPSSTFSPNGPEADNFKLPEPTENSHNPEEFCIQNALEDELVQSIRYLPPSLQVVIQTRYREDASAAQIAKMLGISESVVKSPLFRAKSQIRRNLTKISACAVELTRGGLLLSSCCDVLEAGAT
jgi:RNA polymerase sigma factor (sigma-70 family)